MKKKFIVGLLLFVMCGLVACDEKEPQLETNIAESTEITVEADEIDSIEASTEMSADAAVEPSTPANASPQVATGSSVETSVETEESIGEAEAETGYQIDEDNVIEEYVMIEGLEEEYELLFLTDTHIVLESPEALEQESDNAKQRGAMFRDADGVPSSEQYPVWMDYAIAEEVDGVLLGGDIIDFPSEANVEFLQEQHAQLDMPYVYALGNHDWTYPWDYMTESGKQEYLPMLAPMMGGNTVIQSHDFEEFVVVAVDNSSGQVNPEALDAYEEILEEDKPVILVVHVPLFTDSVLEKAEEVWHSDVVIGNEEVGGIQPNNETEEFVELTTAEDSPIEIVLAGHVHFYDKDYIEGDKEILQLVGDAGYKGMGMHLTISGE